jgi:hypothetical protein
VTQDRLSVAGVLHQFFMYKEGSYKAFSECVDSLANACTNLRISRSYSDQDARGAALNSCFATG